MRRALLVGLSLSVSVLASAKEAGRSLPRGENSPLLIEKNFVVEAGEVQLLRAINGERTVWLRTSSGALLPLQEKPSGACAGWIARGARNQAPEFCEFLFRGESGKSVNIPAREMHHVAL